MPTTTLLCDTADGLARLQYHLMKAGADLELEATTDAFRAVELAARTHPNVIVTEFTLEGLGGSELVKRLLASSPSSVVVGWTEVADPQAIAEIMAAGASGYLVKDDEPEEVLRAIRAAADGCVTLSARVSSLIGNELSSLLRTRGELETEIAAITRRLEEGTAAKADFLSNISHELRTPVTVAKGIAYVLKKPDIPEDERVDFLGQLTNSLDKLMMMVDELITIADIERGTLELDIRESDLAPLLRHAADEMQRQYPRVMIRSLIPEVMVARADAARIGEVVRELLDNACRYSPEDAEVELVARSLDEGAVVQVSDRGQGISRDVAVQAFETPFSTGEATLRKEKAGVGVGLHLARKLVVEHGGILWTDPIPNGGSRVSFCIPAHAGETVSMPPAGLRAVS
jgi:signal transduction histidine kinase